jgi:putative endonuclease
MKMKHFVYIISNPKNIYYKGYSTNLEQRLSFHNDNKGNYTKNKGPWKFLFYTSFISKSEALKFEKMLKKQNHKYLDWLIDSDRNLLKK